MHETVPGPSAMVVIVGPCASGKSTLAEALRLRGFAVRIVAQEHSAVPDLWKRSSPDILIALDVDLEHLRQRRSPTWLEPVYVNQRYRLRNAFAAADLMVDTSALSAEDVLEMVLAWLAASHHQLREMPPPA